MPVSGPTTIRDLLNTIQKGNSHRTVTLGIWALPFKLSELNFANNSHTFQEYSPVPYLPHKVKLHIIQFLLLSRYSLRHRSKYVNLNLRKFSPSLKQTILLFYPLVSYFHYQYISKYSDAPIRRILRFLSSQNVAQFKHGCTFNNQGYIRFHLITDSGIVSLTQEMNHQATPQSITF